jgi:8-oxo-dGTP pyrophosphatase MutT (NUDIX family)
MKKIFRDMDAIALTEAIASAFDVCNQTIGGAGITIIYPPNKSILLGKRSNPDYNAGSWCCFGGTTEPNEEPLTTAFREINEEARINELMISDPIPLYLDIDNNRNGFQFMNYLALASDEFDVHLNKEHSDYGWFPLMSLPNPLHPGMNQMLSDPNVMRTIIKQIVGMT